MHAIYQARFNRYLHEPAAEGHLPEPRLGVPRRRGDGRAGVPRRHRRRGPRGAGQPHVRHQLQPAAPGRAGPRQREDHPGAGVLLPRRRLERHQGRVGPRLGPAAGAGHRRRAGQPDEHDPGRAVPDLLRGVRRLHPGPLLRGRPAAAPPGGAPVRRRPAAPVAGGARLPQALRRLQGRGRAHRAAHRHPRAEHQGLDPRQGLRGAQRHAPDEEALARRAPGFPGPPAPGHQRRGPVGRPAALLPPGGGLRGDLLPARAARRAGRLRPAPQPACQAAAAARREALRVPDEGQRQAGGRHDDGLRAAAAGS